MLSGFELCPRWVPLLLFHGRNLILNKILIISVVYWSTLEGMLIFTSLLLIVIVLLTFIVLDRLRTLYVYAEIIPLENCLLVQENFRHTTLKL